MATDYRQGDYRVVADRLRPASAQLVEWCAPAAATHDHLAVWGTPERIRRQLGPIAADLEVRSSELVGRYDDLDHWWRGRETSPPIAGARARLDDDGYAELGRRMRDTAAQYGELDDGFVLRDAYLVALGRRR